MKSQLRKLSLGLSLASGVALAAADSVKVNGYGQPGWMWTKDASGKTHSFLMADAALYFSHAMDMAEIFVDLPISSQTGTSNSFSLSPYKPQLYIGHKFENGLSWRLGQFDRIFGYAGNDAPDQPFAMSSTLVGNPGTGGMLPITHTGLLLSYDFSEMLGVNAIWADPANQGNKLTTDSYDFAFKVATKVEEVKIGVGLLYQRPTSNTAHYLFDVTAGNRIGPMDLALDMIFSKTTNVETDFGFGLLGVYSITDPFTAAARIEWLRTGSGNTKTKLLQITVGPQYWLTKALRMEADYTLGRTGVGTAKATYSHTLAVAGVYKF